MEKLKNGIKKHPALFLAGYFALYNLVFWTLEMWNRPMHIVHCALDDKLPFCSWAVIPYVLWFGWVPAVFLLFYRHGADSFWRLFRAVSGGIAVSLLTYIVYPTALMLRHPVTGNDFCSRIVAMIYRTDTATNVCPSLHVFITLTLLFALLRATWVRSPMFRTVSTILSVSICASTVLIDQHSLIDVACGAVLSVVMYAVCYRNAPAAESRPILVPFLRTAPSRAQRPARQEA